MGAKGACARTWEQTTDKSASPEMRRSFIPPPIDSFTSARCSENCGVVHSQASRIPNHVEAQLATSEPAVLHLVFPAPRHAGLRRSDCARRAHAAGPGRAARLDHRP